LPAVEIAFGHTVTALVRVLAELSRQIEVLEGELTAHFDRHPDSEILRSQPGLGTVLAARVLAEFGDDPHRYADAKARRNYAATSPITRASGTRRMVLARVAANKRLRDALYLQAFAALRVSPGARAYYDAHRARGATHHQALRALANRLVGILHGCLRHRQDYNEATAWPSMAQEDLLPAA
jgi:transposase